MGLTYEQKCKAQKFVQSTCKKYHDQEIGIYSCVGCPLKENNLNCGWKGANWAYIDFDDIWKYMRKEYCRRHPEVVEELQRRHPNDSRYLHLL